MEFYTGDFVFQVLWLCLWAFLTYEMPERFVVVVNVICVVVSMAIFIGTGFFAPLGFCKTSALTQKR